MWKKHVKQKLHVSKIKAHKLIWSKLIQTKTKSYKTTLVYLYFLKLHCLYFVYIIHFQLRNLAFGGKGANKPQKGGGDGGHHGNQKRPQEVSDDQWQQWKKSDTEVVNWHNDLRF